MAYMFFHATAFNQNLNNWQVPFSLSYYIVTWNIAPLLLYNIVVCLYLLLLNCLAYFLDFFFLRDVSNISKPNRYGFNTNTPKWADVNLPKFLP